ncbi:YeeE/YedE family protein [Neogemmobacter tilapiae]|uniref:YeeE/YedE family protein n=1 Tax=Neogemmobacter tilapiae TaxID=875041 RepID=A0A918TPL6_9RHOB|nr:YeeE/YedE family protein [Gemmobacter tilapiae]GHC57696.1 hypothetical protein GCM10007315_21470 [Gemmobacter tilapiae]
MPMEWLMGLLGGLMIGSAAALYLLVNGRVMGASGIVGQMLDGTAGKTWAERLVFLAALIAIPAVFYLAFGAETHLSGHWALLAVAGFLTGIGTRMANGCTSGHGVCGISRLSPRGIVASVLYVGVGMLTVALFRHGLGWL